MFYLPKYQDLRDFWKSRLNLDKISKQEQQVRIFESRISSEGEEFSLLNQTLNEEKMRRDNDFETSKKVRGMMTCGNQIIGEGGIRKNVTDTEVAKKKVSMVSILKCPSGCNVENYESNNSKK